MKDLPKLLLNELPVGGEALEQHGVEQRSPSNSGEVNSGDRDLSTHSGLQVLPIFVRSYNPISKF